MLYLGADHRGFQLKEEIKTYLQGQGFAFEDLGALSHDGQDDYPLYAHKVAEAVAKEPSNNRGVILCGSGVGVDVVANKEKGVIAGLFFNVQQASEATAHDQVNIAVLPSDYLSVDGAKAIVNAFLTTPYSTEERHVRRVKKIKEIEEE